MCEDNWTQEETDRQDRVDNAIFSVIEEITPIGYAQWDMEIIGDVRDVIMEYVVNQKKWMTEQQFYPYREWDAIANPNPEPDIEEMIVTDEQLVTAMEKEIEDIDSDELALLAGDWLGGLCWYTNDGLFSFIPDEHYCGALDFTKEK
jgi:hypothetical protein